MKILQEILTGNANDARPNGSRSSSLMSKFDQVVESRQRS